MAVRDGLGGAVKGTAWLSIGPRNWQRSAEANLLLLAIPSNQLPSTAEGGRKVT